MQRTTTRSKKGKRRSTQPKIESKLGLEKEAIESEKEQKTRSVTKEIDEEERENMEV